MTQIKIFVSARHRATPGGLKRERVVADQISVLGQGIRDANSIVSPSTMNLPKP